MRSTAAPAAGLATVTARIVDLPNGRVDVVFTIDEGSKTGVKDINFVGNRAFSSGRLRDLMTTTESNLLSFIKTSDIYDPDRIASDLELIRRYYLKNGYADFRVVSTEAPVRRRPRRLHRHHHGGGRRAVPGRRGAGRFAAARRGPRDAARAASPPPPGRSTMPSRSSGR